MAIERYTTLKTQLKDEIKKSNFRIRQLQKQIEVAKKQVDVNDGKIRKNADEIALLNSSIQKTNNQTNLIKAYIDDIDTFLSEAEAVLKSSVSSE